MTLLEANKLVVRRLIEDAANTGCVGILDQIIAPDCLATDGRTRIPCGVAGMAAHIQAVRQTYPDLHITIENQIAEGEWVATQITARGTHLGSWLEMAPTGKRVTISGIDLDRVVNGRIVEHGGAANTFEALLEVGAIRTVKTAESR